MSIEKDVLYRLKVVSDPGNSKAFEDLQKQSAQAKQKAAGSGSGSSAATSSRAGGGERAGGGSPHGPGGLAEMFLGKPFMGALAGAAIGIGLAAKAATEFAFVLKTASNETLTRHAKDRRYIDRYVPFSQTANEILDDETGITRQRRELDRRRRVDLPQQQLEIQAGGDIRRESFRASDASANARGAADAAAMVAGNPELQRQLAGDRRLGHAAQRKIDALSEAAAAKYKTESAGNEVTAARQRAGEADAEVNRLRGKLPRNEDIKDRVDQLRAEQAAQQLTEANVAQQAALNRLKEAESRHEGAAVEAIQKKNEAMRAGIELGRARLGIIDEELQRYKSGANSFGGLRPYERANAVATAERINKFGIDSASDADIELVGRAGFSGLLDKQRIAAGEKDQNWARAQQLFGEADKRFLKPGEEPGFRDIGAILGERAKVQNEISINVQLDHKKMAEEIAEIVGKAVKEINVTNRRAVEAGKAAIADQERQGQLQQR